MRLPQRGRDARATWLQRFQAMPQDLAEYGDPAAWDRALEAFATVPPSQTGAWGGTPDFRGQQILRFASATPGAIALQGMLKRSLGLSRFIAFDGPVIGAACDEPALIAFFAALRARLGRHCLISFICIQPYDVNHEIWLRRAGFLRPWTTSTSPLTLYVDCGNGKLEAAYGSDWRKNIKKAAKRLPVFEALPLTDAAARADLLAIYTETFRIKGAAEHMDAQALEALARDPRWHVFFASLEGKRVSFRLVFVSGTTAFDNIAGTNAEGRNASASHFLAAAVLQRLGEMGVKQFDFGRIGPGRYDSIDHFKRGAGGRPVTYLGEWSQSASPWTELALSVQRFARSRERW